MFYTNDIDHLIKNIDCINYFDIGSRKDGEKGWIDLINSKLKKSILRQRITLVYLMKKKLVSFI